MKLHFLSRAKTRVVRNFLVTTISHFIVHFWDFFLHFVLKITPPLVFSKMLIFFVYNFWLLFLINSSPEKFCPLAELTAFLKVFSVAKTNEN